MINIDEALSIFVVLWAVIDPVGTVPVFIAVTKGYDSNEKKKIALQSSFLAWGILLLFLVVGEVVLKRMGVPLSAFQISGGIILLLFALDMVFGDSKPESEIQLAKTSRETAIFPLAIPSMAGPGAILAVVLLADNSRNSIQAQGMVAAIVTFIMIINYFLVRASDSIHRKIGNSGAIVISKIMGMILASVAANNILVGIKEFFKIN